MPYKMFNKQLIRKDSQYEVGKTFKQVYHEGKMRRRYSIQLVSPELY